VNRTVEKLPSNAHRGSGSSAPEVQFAFPLAVQFGARFGFRF
jgi:hypothetical protein